MVTVPDDGRRDARIVLVGEAPGKREVEKGKPFIGPSGGLLETWWRRFGLSREMFYITNVVPYLPANIDTIPEEEMREHIAALLCRLSALDGPLIIVPVGNYALYSTTGKGKVSFHHKDGKHERPGISDWRGSILSMKLNGRDVTVIPTLHPAYVLREPGMERRCLKDWERIAAELREPGTPPERFHHIKPTLEDVELFVREAARAKYLALDIETPRHWIREYAVVVGTREEPGKPKKIGLGTKCADCGHTLKMHTEPPGFGPMGACRKKLKGVACLCSIFTAPAPAPKVTEVIEWRAGVKRTDTVTLARFKSGDKKGEPKSRLVKGPSYVGCIGLSIDPRYSITVPLTKKYWGEAKLERVKALIGALLTDPTGPELVMQNGMFDASWLAWAFGWDTAGIRPGRVQRWRWCTRAMHHALDPRDDHDLAYMASILTRQPFWKHEAKDPDEIMKYANNNEALWTYCGIDTCVTLEIFLKMKEELEAVGLLEFYHRHYSTMIPPLLDMLLHGINVDKQTMENERVRLDAMLNELARKLEALTGESLLGDSGGISNKKLAHYLYTTLKLPPQYKRGKFGERRITTDEFAVRRLLLRNPKKLGESGPMILDYRRISKQREFLDPVALDADGRMRCQYSFTTEAARLASHGTGWGTGRNLQNIDRELRYVFIPDQD